MSVEMIPQTQLPHPRHSRRDPKEPTIGQVTLAKKPSADYDLDHVLNLVWLGTA